MGITEILSAFCSPDTPRFSRPWTSDGYTLATDSRIVIRTKLPVDLQLGDEPVKGLTDDFWSGLKHPAVPLPPMTPLPALGERAAKKCDECFGSGTVTCEYDHDHECPECEGDGNVVDEPSIFVSGITLGNVVLGGIYARVLAAINVEPRPGEHNKPVGFIGDGFEGLVMPCKDAGTVEWTASALKRFETLLGIKVPAKPAIPERV